MGVADGYDNLGEKNIPIDGPTAARDPKFRRNVARYLFIVAIGSVGIYSVLMVSFPQRPITDALLALGSASVGGLVTTLARAVRD